MIWDPCSQAIIQAYLKSLTMAHVGISGVNEFGGGEDFAAAAAELLAV